MLFDLQGTCSVKVTTVIGMLFVRAFILRSQQPAIILSMPQSPLPKSLLLLLQLVVVVLIEVVLCCLASAPVLPIGLLLGASSVTHTSGAG